MIGASKILTVSYGTFSCTLEGFDDPFNTMRAIAEYFRDLAAEDRYFGAEPPTPDAAMLLKIAEREVQRRVEAKINENGVVLRTGDAMQSPSRAPTMQPSAPVSVATQAPQPIQSAPPQTAMPDGVAAKLLRIRAAVATAELADTRAEAAAAPVASSHAEPILADYSEDQHADEIATSTTLTATFAPDGFAVDSGDADVWDEPTYAAPDAGYDEEPDLAEVAVPTAEMPVQEASFAIPTPLADPDTDADFAAASDADDTLLAALNSADAPDLAAAEPVAEDTALDTEDYTISDDEMADLRALDGEGIAAPIALEADTSADFTLDDDTNDAFDEDHADLVETEETDASDLDLEADFDDAPASVEPAAVIDPMIEEIDNAYEGPDPDADLVPTSGPSAKALRARARVIKVRRDDVETVPAAIPDTTATDISAMLAADAEADLRRELRALQQQSIATPAVQFDDSDDDTGPDDEAGPEDDARQRLDNAGEAAVSRLIEQTNEAMAVPENRRRLSAIAHLKAAVAATVADRFAKGGVAPKEAETKRLDPYREDLARVVRPLHPAGSDDAPATPRPAPLVLVSAQRIDRPRVAPTDGAPILASVPNSPVRPRRVTSAALAVDTTAEIDEEEDSDAANVFSDARGFAEFSERLGANSLAEILEAAAAYSVCIEGRPYFSRPQLMSQIGALSADSEFSREDGLRTFGALLREGRIQKIKRGQFVLTEGSRYLAEARALAG